MRPVAWFDGLGISYRRFYPTTAASALTGLARGSNCTGPYPQTHEVTNTTNHGNTKWFIKTMLAESAHSMDFQPPNERNRRLPHYLRRITAAVFIRMTGHNPIQ